ncbi:MAG: hypothetical protein ACPHP1_08675 [Miltoncostaeaceae bacterium]
MGSDDSSPIARIIVPVADINHAFRLDRAAQRFSELREVGNGPKARAMRLNSARP